MSKSNKLVNRDFQKWNAISIFYFCLFCGSIFLTSSFLLILEYELIISRAEIENVLNLVSEFTRNTSSAQYDTAYDEEDVLDQGINQAISNYGLGFNRPASHQHQIEDHSQPGPSNSVYVDDSSNSLSSSSSVTQYNATSSKIEDVSLETDQIEFQGILNAINKYGLKCSEVPRNNDEVQ